jgi:hypothetical protein
MTRGLFHYWPILIITFLSAWYLLTPPVTIHKTYGESDGKAFSYTNDSSKNMLTIIFCETVPESIVIQEDEIGRRKKEVDNSSGQGTGNKKIRSWTHSSTFSSKLLDGEIKVWKRLKYTCPIANKVLETEVLILEKKARS